MSKEASWPAPFSRGKSRNGHRVLGALLKWRLGIFGRVRHNHRSGDTRHKPRVDLVHDLAVLTQRANAINETNEDASQDEEESQVMETASMEPPNVHDVGTLHQVDSNVAEAVNVKD